MKWIIDLNKRTNHLNFDWSKQYIWVMHKDLIVMVCFG
jgi:hypothetical protein